MMTNGEYLRQFYAEVWKGLQAGGLESLSRLQRDCLCVWAFQTEVNNGGVHQYLFNSSGDIAAETPEVFRRIGAAEAATILEEANANFGPDGPQADRTARQLTLLALPEQIQAAIHALTCRFYDAEDAGMSLADLVDAHVFSQRH